MKKKKEKKEKITRKILSWQKSPGSSCRGVTEEMVGDAPSNQPLSPRRFFSIVELVVAGVKVVALRAASRFTCCV